MENFEPGFFNQDVGNADLRNRDYFQYRFVGYINSRPMNSIRAFDALLRHPALYVECRMLTCALP